MALASQNKIKASAMHLTEKQSTIKPVYLQFKTFPLDEETFNQQSVKKSQNWFQKSW